MQRMGEVKAQGMFSQWWQRRTVEAWRGKGNNSGLGLSGSPIVEACMLC